MSVLPVRFFASASQLVLRRLSADNLRRACDLVLSPTTVVRRRTVLLFSFLLVAVTFADVLFKHASLSMLDNQNITGVTREYTALYPEEHWRLPYMGYYDSGGAGFQSEPAQLFMKNVIYGVESPYWDPYTGGGSFGPELLVDLKFSPFTVLAAALGASSKAFHFSCLFLYALGVFFLFRLCNAVLRLSPVASMGGCIVFLMSGYFTANLNSNVIQSYFYIPAALYFLLSFNRDLGKHDLGLNPARTARHFALGALSIAAIFTCTFIPTTALALTLVFSVAVLDALGLSSSPGNRWKRALLTASAFAVAGLLVAPLYLPILEVLKFTKGLEAYGERHFYPANWKAFISLLTPKHFAESYNAGSPEFLQFQENVVFHFGIIPALLALQAFGTKDRLKSPIIFVLGAVALGALGRIFGVPGVTQIVEHLPFFRNLGCQYWWMGVGPVVPLLVAFGLENTLHRRTNLRLAWAGVIGVVAAYLLVATYVGLPSDKPGYLPRGQALFYLRVAAFLTLAAVAYFEVSSRRWRLRWLPESRLSYLPLVILGLIFIELTFDMNHVRFRRMDVSTPPDYVDFLHRNLGENRIANFGLHGVPAQMGAAYRVPQLESFAMNQSPDYAELCNRAITNEVIGTGSVAFCTSRGDSNGVKVNQDILDMMSVKYLVVSKYMKKYIDYFDSKSLPKAFESIGVKIYENRSPLPRLFAVPTLVRGALTPEAQGLSAKTAATTLDDELLGQAAALGVGTAPTKAPDDKLTPGKILEYHHASIEAEIDLPSPAILVLMDNWNPNWTATVDGAKAYIGKINQSFRGIALGAGKHRISMTYRPRTLTLGLIIAALGVVLLLTSRFWMGFIVKSNSSSEENDRRTQ